MNRFLRIAFLCLAMMLAGYAALFGNYMRAGGASPLSSKMVWAAMLGAFFLGFAAWRFSLRSKFRLFSVLMSLLVLELLLQAAAWLGVLPGVGIKIKAPYARSYWTTEGRGNGIRNRFGWNYPEFNLKATKRIAVIGDSFVEAVEVNRDHNEAAILQQLFNRASQDCSVLGFGTHGTCPAFHLEVLDYAQRHFAPQEAVVLIYLGNDINESSPALNYAPPSSFIYYDLNAEGQLTILPESAALRSRFVRSMEFSHQSLTTCLPIIINSYCMTLQSALSLRDLIGRAGKTRALAAADPESSKYGRIGLSLKPFVVPPGVEARHALDVMFAELTQLKQKCEANRIQLRLVTIPYFPPQFYKSERGPAWSLKIDGYDFLAPDREIASYARLHDIPFLSLADWMMEKKMPAEEIRKLYFTNGSGHFSELGHRLCAEAIFDTFYTKPKP